MNGSSSGRNFFNTSVGKGWSVRDFVGDPMMADLMPLTSARLEMTECLTYWRKFCLCYSCYLVAAGKLLMLVNTQC